MFLYANPDADQFFYDKGFADGKKEGLRMGYAKAKKEMMKKLKRRVSSIKAMEAGKYLSRKHKITAPEIYQIRNPDGTLSIKVKGCRLEKELTLEEIVRLPNSPEGAWDNEAISSDTHMPAQVSSMSHGQTGVSNGVFVPGIDSSRHATPRLVSSATNTHYVYLPNTEFYIGILRMSDVVFTITNGGERIKVRFDSNQQRENFLLRYGLEPGRDVR
jgi:hypothetical protein